MPRKVKPTVGWLLVIAYTTMQTARTRNGGEWASNCVGKTNIGKKLLEGIN